jgi:hypothetical protein
VEHVQERELETVFDLRDLVEGERGFVELAVGDAVVDDAVDEIAECLGRGGAKGARGGFEAVGEGDDGALFELRARAGVAEGGLGDFRMGIFDFRFGRRDGGGSGGDGGVGFRGFGGGLSAAFGAGGGGGAGLGDGAVVEIADEAGAVVLADDVEDGAGEIVAGGELDAVGDVLADDAGGLGGVAGSRGGCGRRVGFR